MTKIDQALRLIVILPVLSAVSYAASRVECDSVPSKYVSRAVHYCALLPASFPTSTDASTLRGNAFPVLYFLHGLGQDSQSLFDDGVWNLVDELRAQKKLGEFVIITPDAGRSFYINSKDARTRYEDFFLKEFIPAMEKRYHLAHSRAARAISGISMGGYGALRLAFAHPELFSSVSAHSAALIETLPKGAGQAGVGGFIGPAFGRPLDADYWKKESPFVFARTANLKGLKIYFDCGDHDQYGFENGAESLHKILTSRKIQHEFHVYPGGHDWPYFSAHLPASLEFDSKALGK
jgi:S-formylglutathione hydrolase FrmB